MPFKTIALPNGAEVNFPEPPAPGDAGALQQAIDDIAKNLNILNSLIASQQVTITFANEAARTAATPAFVGQLGLQIDTGVLYSGTGTSAGSWDVISLGS